MGILDGDFTIVIVGRLEEQKGHINFLNSVKKIIIESKIKVVIVGDGSKKEEIENFNYKNDLSDNVFLTGFQSDTQKYIEISDLVIIPSLWEGFGIVACEGMIKGKVVLASNVGGLTEIIDDTNNGFIYDIFNSEQLNSKILYIMQNINNFDELKNSAKRKVKEKFDIYVNSLEYENFYKDCLNARKIN